MVKKPSEDITDDEPSLYSGNAKDGGTVRVYITRVHMDRVEGFLKSLEEEVERLREKDK